MRFLNSAAAAALTLAFAFAPGAKGEELAATMNVGSKLNGLTAQQWVHVDKTNLLRGSVVVPRGKGMLDSVSSPTVMLVDANGRVIQTKGDENGAFELTDVAPDTYGLYVASDQGAACYALYVLPASDSNVKPDSQDVVTSGASFHQPAHVPSELIVSAAPIDPSLVQTTLRSYLSPRQPAPARYESYVNDPLGSDRLSSDLFSVAAQPDGSLAGQLQIPSGEGVPVAPLQMTNVLVVADDTIVSRTTADDSGSFRIENLQPGIYGLIAAGPAGFATLGFDLVGPVNVSQHDSDATVRFAALRQPPSGSLNVVMTPAPITVGIGTFGPAGDRDRGVGILGRTGRHHQGILGGGHFGGGGMGAGGGGGGGLLGGGGGGLGGLAALGAIGAALAASSDDGDVRPASPFAP